MAIDFKAELSAVIKEMKEEKGLLPDDSLYSEKEGTFSLEESAKNTYTVARTAYSKKAIPALYNILVLSLKYLDSSDIQPSPKLFTNFTTLDPYCWIPYIVDETTAKWGQKYLDLLKKTLDDPGRFDNLSIFFKAALRLIGDKRALEVTKSLHDDLSARLKVYQDFAKIKLAANERFKHLEQYQPSYDPTKEELSIFSIMPFLSKANDIKDEIDQSINSVKFTPAIKEAYCEELVKLKADLSCIINRENFEKEMTGLVQEQKNLKNEFPLTVWLPNGPEERTLFIDNQEGCYFEVSEEIPVVRYNLFLNLKSTYEKIIIEKRNLLSIVDICFASIDKQIERVFTLEDKIKHAANKVEKITKFIELIDSLSLTALVENDKIKDEVGQYELEQSAVEKLLALFSQAKQEYQDDNAAKATAEAVAKNKAARIATSAMPAVMATIVSVTDALSRPFLGLTYLLGERPLVILKTQREKFAHELKNIFSAQLKQNANQLAQLQAQKKEKINSYQQQLETAKKILIDQVTGFINNTSWWDWIFRKDNIFNTYAKDAAMLLAALQTDTKAKPEVEHNVIYMAEYFSKKLQAVLQDNPQLTNFSLQLQQFNTEHQELEKLAPVEYQDKLKAILTICKHRKARAFWNFFGYGNVYNAIEIYVDQLIAQPIVSATEVAAEIKMIYKKYYPNEQNTDEPPYFVNKLLELLDPPCKPAQAVPSTHRVLAQGPLGQIETYSLSPVSLDLLEKKSEPTLSLGDNSMTLMGRSSANHYKMNELNPAGIVPTRCDNYSSLSSMDEKQESPPLTA